MSLVKAISIQLSCLLASSFTPQMGQFLAFQPIASVSFYN